MAKLSNHPLASVPHMLAKSLRKNRAVLRYNCVIEDRRTAYRREWHFDRNIWLREVERADAYLISIGLYQANDLRVTIPALCLLETRGMLESDEVVTVDGVRQTLEMARPWKTGTGGIVPNVDSVVFNGVVYRILNVKAEDFWNGDAREYTVQLRS